MILSTNNVSLTNNKNTFAGRKNEDTKVEAKKKIVVQQETVSLFLQQNQIYSINGLSAIMDEVMYNPQRLLWIDLSTNYLKEIDEDLATAFP